MFLPAAKTTSCAVPDKVSCQGDTSSLANMAVGSAPGSKHSGKDSRELAVPVCGKALHYRQHTQWQGLTRASSSSLRESIALTRPTLEKSRSVASSCSPIPNRSKYLQHMPPIERIDQRAEGLLNLTISMP